MTKPGTKPGAKRRGLIRSGTGLGACTRAARGGFTWSHGAKSWRELWDSVAQNLTGPSRDIALAQGRLGETTDERCGWLLDTFVPRDPDTLSRSERALVLDNLLALTDFPTWDF